MNIAVYGSRRQEAYAAQLQQLLVSLHTLGHNVAMASKLYNHLHDLGVNLAGVERVHDMPVEADVALSIGGDGTFLRTAQWVGALETPVLGVNTGHLGYLAAVTLDELVANLSQYINHNPEVSHRSVLMVKAPGLNIWPYALNEIALSKDQSASMITASVCLDGRPLADYRADGILIATPTGSTAYNLSVGGPIIQPTAPVWVLSPIAAHSLSMRPMVVNQSSQLEIRCHGRTDSFRLSLDGRSVTLPIDTAVDICLAPFNVNIVVTPQSRFPEPLRRKLMFN